MTMCNPATLRYTANRTLVVSRHKGALDWLARRGIDVSGAKAEITPAEVDSDTLIVGNVPLALASRAAAVAAIQFSGQPPRGAEYTADDMDQAGAHLALYWVHGRPAIGMWRAADEIEQAWSGRMPPSEYDLSAERARADGLIEAARWYETLAQIARARKAHDSLAAAVTTAADADWIPPDAGEILDWARLATPEELANYIDEREKAAREWDFQGLNCMAIEERARAAVVRWAIAHGLTRASVSTGRVVVRSGERVASWPGDDVDELAAALRGWWATGGIQLSPEADQRWRIGVMTALRAISGPFNEIKARQLDGALRLLALQTDETLPPISVEWRPG